MTHLDEIKSVRDVICKKVKVVKSVVEKVRRSHVWLREKDKEPQGLGFWRGR